MPSELIAVLHPPLATASSGDDTFNLVILAGTLCSLAYIGITSRLISQKKLTIFVNKADLFSTAGMIGSVAVYLGMLTLFLSDTKTDTPAESRGILFWTVLTMGGTALGYWASLSLRRLYEVNGKELSKFALALPLKLLLAAIMGGCVITGLNAIFDNRRSSKERMGNILGSGIIAYLITRTVRDKDP